MYYQSIKRYYKGEQMSVRVTSKGQVTIPKPVRDRLGIAPGTQVEFELAEDGRAFLRRLGKRQTRPSRFERMRGTATSGLTTDEIMKLTRDDAR
jgi:antitoxin PrlF